jgi:ABC-type uncharacterized transport system permease subunit
VDSKLSASIALFQNGLRVAASEKMILLFGMCYNSLFVFLFACVWNALPASFAIGLLDVWGQYARPVYWIWQKSLFVLGGLMLPLSLYPSWMQKLAAVTPFPAMVYLPATMVFQPDASGFESVLTRQLFWLVALMLVAIAIHNGARKQIGTRGD